MTSAWLRKVERWKGWKASDFSPGAAARIVMCPLTAPTPCKVAVNAAASEAGTFPASANELFQLQLD